MKSTEAGLRAANSAVSEARMTGGKKYLVLIHGVRALIRVDVARDHNVDTIGQEERLVNGLEAFHLLVVDEIRVVRGGVILHDEPRSLDAIDGSHMAQEPLVLSCKAVHRQGSARSELESKARASTREVSTWGVPAPNGM